MVVERRVFNRLPQYLQTDQNNRDTHISDDVMFEPERAGFVSGYIGETGNLSQDDLRRNPIITEDSAQRQKYQLSLGAVYVDPETGVRSGGAFYPDLINQIAMNGGITDDPNRLFGTPFYAWTPPVDYDKHLNFSRYYWTGEGDAAEAGEYITKETQGSQTIVYRLTSTGFQPRWATLSRTAPSNPSRNDLWEDLSDSRRVLRRWSGASWTTLPYQVVENVPSSTAGYNVGDWLYVTRTGPAFNRPLLWKYSEAAGRWLSQPVVIGPMPETPVEGMIWEDSTVNPRRTLKVFRGGFFEPLDWEPAHTISGIPEDGTYLYDIRAIDEIADGWSTNNWWRHYDDLSVADRAALGSNRQATRPILEFWAGLSMAPDSTREMRNDLPSFKVFKINPQSRDIVSTNHETTLFQYQIGTGANDAVLGFPLSYDNTGEFLFELTLETDTISGVSGYRFFRDDMTGLCHCIWAKSDIPLQQEIDDDGLAEVPRNLTSNPNHEVLKIASRSKMIRHLSGVIGEQDGVSGNRFGSNNYRWTDRNPTLGSTIIDSENTLLRAMATLQRPNLQIPDVIRRVSRDYNRVMSKFLNRMNQLWNDSVFSDASDQLLITPDEAVDVILTEIFMGRGEEFPYYHSDMGTYEETQIANGEAAKIGIQPKPIFIPPSPARIGASPAFAPSKITDADGITRLRGHEGMEIEAFGDARDDIWITLQTRFFERVPFFFKTESEDFSARHSESNFHLSRYYGNASPTTTTNPVHRVVQNYNEITDPYAGLVVYSISHGVFAYFDGTKWLTKQILVDDIFVDQSTGDHYIYNGFGGFKIDLFNRPKEFDYSQEEFRQIMRREFERWAVFLNEDFVTNDQFDKNNPFTWNYRSSGVEGHYQGIYQRLYRTIRPHSHPWEVMGYSVEPTWWRSVFPPTGIAPDGTPRYADTHNMWHVFQQGIFDAQNDRSSDEFMLTAPIPVDAQGELLDPIAAGVVDENKLVPERLDDSWVYGDGAPVEQKFRRSAHYGFALAMQGYLMKPSLFVDRLWSELYVDIGAGGSNPVWRAPHAVHKDYLLRPAPNGLAVHLEKSGQTVVVRPGLNAWISEYNRAIGNEIEKSFGRVIRNTEVSVGWRCAGFINRDRTILQTLGGIKIPYEDVHTLLHRSVPTTEQFGSGVLVSREGTGYRVYGFDLFRPYFEIDAPAVSTRGAQVELREEFIAEQDQHQFVVSEFALPRHLQDDDRVKLAVMVNGLRLKPQHISVIDRDTFQIESVVRISAGDVVVASVVSAPSAPSTRVKQFQINGVSFPYVDHGTGKIERVEYGRYFDTSTDVINFMLAYGRKLEKDGWVFENSVGTGVVRDWMYGSRQFATWVLENRTTWNPNGAPEEDFLFSPFIGSAKFQSDFGQILNVESLQNGAYGILDRDANPIDPNQVFTSRIGNSITLTPKDGTADIFGVRVLVAEDQHVVFLSSVTKFNDLIYDPVTALYQTTLRLDTYRSKGWNGRLEADGFVINQGDLLPNFEKQAKDFTRYYDRIDTLDDPVKRDQARELYGWYPNDEYVNANGDHIPMMDALQADDRTRFDYHRGMMHTKGTIRPLIAFARGTRLGSDNVLFHEDWAWRWTDFGDMRRDLVQFRLKKNDFKDQIQVVAFNRTPNDYDSILQVPSFDRSKPNEGPWIIPPMNGDDSVGTYEFPLKSNGTFDTKKYRFRINLLDLDTRSTQLRLFHFDPINGLFEPGARSQIDYVTTLDPARYSDGAGAEYSNDMEWGEDQVGQIWWDQSRLSYMDYRSRLPQMTEVAKEWGRLEYFKATIARNGNIARITTKNPYTGANAAHGLSDGDEIEISGAVPSGYNGRHTVTVAGTNVIEIKVQQALTTPATGEIKVRVGFVDIHEWVESPVPPSGWANYVNSLTGNDAPAGTPIHGNATSYVTRRVVSATGSVTNKYFFWIKDNTGVNPKKTLTTSEISSRIFNPTQNNIGWFAPVNKQHMLVFTDGEIVQNDYAMEIVQDSRDMEYHTEWVLISEGDRFNPVPDLIRDKLVDSLSGEDIHGHAVPSPHLSETEKLGSENFPPQTVFPDRARALAVFVETVNRILARKNLNTVADLSTTFAIGAEGSTWNRAAYREPIYEDKAVLDTVATEAVRANRLQQGRYVNGDLVRVIQSSNVDLWTGEQIPTTYVLQDGAFIEVGADAHTLSISIDEDDHPDLIRDVFASAYGLLDRGEQNDLVFALLYEMMNQNPTADWFMKTSYVVAQILDQISTSPFVRPDEVEAILANFQELKPYRTKLRASTFSYAAIPDIANVLIDERPDQKISLWFDRVSCGTNEDKVEGENIWDWPNLGRDRYFVIGSLPGETGKTEYEFDTVHDPRLYEFRVVLLQNGSEVDPSEFGIGISMRMSVRKVFVTLSSPLTSSFVVQLRQNSGFYEGSAPTLGGDLVNSAFQPASSDYEHHAVRALGSGEAPPLLGMEGCTFDPPVAPPERLANESGESVSIKVTIQNTAAYQGWDAMPWDTIPWDTGPAELPDRTFFILSGEEEWYADGLHVLATSEVVTSHSDQFVGSETNFHRLAGVKVGSIMMTEGVDYEIVESAPWFAEFTPPIPVYYTATASGETISTEKIPTGVHRLYLNDELISENELTRVVGGIKINPKGVEVEFDAEWGDVRYYTGDGVTTAFDVGIPRNSMNTLNIFVFVGSTILDVSEYTIGQNSQVVLDVAPGNGDIVTIFGLGNQQGYGLPVFEEHFFTGDGSTTDFPLEGYNPMTTWVFVDRVYQRGSEDYGIMMISGDTLEFTNAPGSGTEIYVRQMKPNAYETNRYLTHTVYDTTILAPGSVSFGLNMTRINKSKAILFIDSDLQQGYGAPDPSYEIRWNSFWEVQTDSVLFDGPPAYGSILSLRVLQKVRVIPEIFEPLRPQPGDVVKMIPQTRLNVGDTVTLFHDTFSVGPTGSFRVTSAPTGYTVSNGKLILDELFENGFINLTYVEPFRYNNPLAIFARMDRIVDLAINDHQALDDGPDITTGRVLGLRVLNTTNARVYVWTATGWNYQGETIPLQVDVLVLQDQKVVRRTDNGFVTISETGDPYPSPPMLEYPKWGRGVFSATYALGSLPTANEEYPAAYQIMNHPGDY